MKSLLLISCVPHVGGYPLGLIENTLMDTGRAFGVKEADRSLRDLCWIPQERLLNSSALLEEVLGSEMHLQPNVSK